MSTAESLSEEDRRAYETDLHEHARYGEPEELSALLKLNLVSIDAKDGGGSTALHKACANGELECVKLLVEHKATQHVNSSGASPLAWAVLNKQADVVQFMVEQFSDSIDVLAPVDASGKKSLLTMGFDSQTEPILKCLLMHKSAATLDTKQPSGKKPSEKEEKNNRNPNAEPLAKTRAESFTHVFAFPLKDQEQKGKVSVRELSTSFDEDSKSGDLLGITNGETDITGLYVWPASILLARWVLKNAESFAGKQVIELGSGCGLPGLTALTHTDATTVLLSDFQARAVENLTHNIGLNGDAKTGYAAARIDWNDTGTWPEGSKGSYDIVLGSDLVYHEALVPLLTGVVSHFVKSGGLFVYAHAAERNGVSEFISKLIRGGDYDHSQIIPAAKDGYFDNPLLEGDLDFVDLCFPGLHEDSEMIIHVFKKL